MIMWRCQKYKLITDNKRRLPGTPRRAQFSIGTHKHTAVIMFCWHTMPGHHNHTPEATLIPHFPWKQMLYCVHTWCFIDHINQCFIILVQFWDAPNHIYERSPYPQQIILRTFLTILSHNEDRLWWPGHGSAAQECSVNWQWSLHIIGAVIRWYHLTRSSSLWSRV